VDILDRVPAMADDALGNLLANAERLERSGSKAQRASAAGLLPALRVEVEARRAAKLARTAETRRVASENRASARKAKAAAAEAA
jgi:hypothetical protein